MDSTLPKYLKPGILVLFVIFLVAAWYSYQKFGLTEIIQDNKDHTSTQCSCEDTQLHLKVLTNNVFRSLETDTKFLWAGRKEFVASYVLFFEPDIIGFQEVTQIQLEDFRHMLKNYKFIGVARDDGKSKGERVPIGYKLSELEILESDTFWLSETPDIPSHGWGSTPHPRIVTWAKFYHKRSKTVFFQFNTHFTTKPKIAKSYSARLLLQKVKEIAGNHLSILTGDYNSKQDSDSFKILTNKSNPDHVVNTRLISQTPHFGPVWTGNGIRKEKELKERGGEIDYIFVKGNVKVLKHAAFSMAVNKSFASDHSPVYAELLLHVAGP